MRPRIDADLRVQLTRQLDDNITRHARQHIVRVRVGPHFTVDDAEEVGVRAFGNHCLADEDRFERVVVRRELFRHYGRQQVHGLQVAARPAVIRIRRHRDALRSDVTRRYEGRSGEKYRGRRARGREVVCPWRRATGDLQVDRALPLEHVVVPDQTFLQRSDGIEVETGVDAQLPKTAPQAFRVPVPFKESAANNASHFIHAVAEEEAAIVDGEFGLAPFEKLTIQVNN